MFMDEPINCTTFIMYYEKSNFSDEMLITKLLKTKTFQCDRKLKQKSNRQNQLLFTSTIITMTFKIFKSIKYYK